MIGTTTTPDLQEQAGGFALALAAWILFALLSYWYVITQYWYYYHLFSNYSLLSVQLRQFLLYLGSTNLFGETSWEWNGCGLVFRTKVSFTKRVRVWSQTIKGHRSKLYARHAQPLNSYRKKNLSLSHGQNIWQTSGLPRTMGAWWSTGISVDRKTRPRLTNVQASALECMWRQ